MSRRVLAIDRSQLARNVYFIILSKLGELDLLHGEDLAALDQIGAEPARFHLLILDHNTVGDRRKEFLAQFKKEEEAFKRMPALLIVPQGKRGLWDEFVASAGVKVLERPFHPDRLLEVVKGLWNM